MARNTQIIRIPSMNIIVRLLVISETKFWPLLVQFHTMIKLNYLISNQTHGQRKLHFLSAQRESNRITGMRARLNRFQFVLLWSRQSQIIRTVHWRIL